jgi:hypothetical protein
MEKQMRANKIYCKKGKKKKSTTKVSSKTLLKVKIGKGN